MRTTDQVRARRWLWATLPVAALLLAAAGMLGFQLGAVARGVARGPALIAISCIAACAFPARPTSQKH